MTTARMATQIKTTVLGLGGNEYTAAVLVSEEFAKLASQNIADGMTEKDALVSAFEECQHNNSFVKVDNALRWNKGFLNHFASQSYNAIRANQLAVKS